MPSYSSAATGRSSTSQPATPLPDQFNYVRVPQKLLLSLRDTPLAIGIYILIMRLVATTKAPVPLSGPDIVTFDPTLKRGQAVRALKRLTTSGWVVGTYADGKKTAYLPTWGCVNRTPCAWTSDESEPANGRPRHVNIYRVDCLLLDTCMGKIDLHERHKAVITRYLTTPIIGLVDIGVYALALVGLHQGATTPALERLGVLLANRTPFPLPPETTILATASQQAMSAGEYALTPQGAAKLGVPLQPSIPSDETAQPLFFIPPDQFGSMTGGMIDHMIGERDRDHLKNEASGTHESTPTNMALGSHGLGCTSMETDGSAAQSPAGDGGGSPQIIGRSIWSSAPKARTDQDDRVDTESAQLLREIGIKSPVLIVQLAQLPIEVIRSAIATASSRPTTRDIAAVVGRMLRDFRDHGTPIAEPVRPANRGATAAEIRESYKRLGYVLSDDAYVDMQHTGGVPADVGALVVSAEGGVAPVIASPAELVPLLTPSTVTLWNDVQAALQTQLPRAEFTTWIRPLSLLSIVSGVVTIQVPNALTKEAIENRYLSTLRNLFALFTGETLRVRVILGTRVPAHRHQAAAAAAPGMDAR